MNAIIQRLESMEEREVGIAGLYTRGMMAEKYDTMVLGRTLMGEGNRAIGPSVFPWSTRSDAFTCEATTPFMCSGHDLILCGSES